MATAIAFSNASLVMIWRGRMPGLDQCDDRTPGLVREVVAAAVDGRCAGRPGSDMPSASATDAIVLAVNIPAHEPSVGQARFSISPSSLLDQRARRARADGLEDAHDVEGLVLVVAGQDRARRRGTPTAR